MHAELASRPRGFRPGGQFCGAGCPACASASRCTGCANLDSASAGTARRLKQSLAHAQAAFSLSYTQLGLLPAMYMAGLMVACVILTELCNYVNSFRLVGARAPLSLTLHTPGTEHPFPLPADTASHTCWASHSRPAWTMCLKAARAEGLPVAGVD